MSSSSSSSSVSLRFRCLFRAIATQTGTNTTSTRGPSGMTSRARRVARSPTCISAKLDARCMPKTRSVATSWSDDDCRYCIGALSTRIASRFAVFTWHRHDHRHDHHHHRVPVPSLLPVCYSSRPRYDHAFFVCTSTESLEVPSKTSASTR